LVFAFAALLRIGLHLTKFEPAKQFIVGIPASFFATIAAKQDRESIGPRYDGGKYPLTREAQWWLRMKGHHQTGFDGASGSLGRVHWRTTDFHRCNAPSVAAVLCHDGAVRPFP
jgi:hypothetical protein